MPQLLSNVVLPSWSRVEAAFQDVVLVAQPAPSLGISVTAGGAELIVPLAVTTSLVTDATAGNRTVFVGIYDEDAHRLHAVPMPATQPPSSTMFYTWSIDTATSYTVNQFGLALLPTLTLFPGWQITVEIPNSGAGDQLSASRFTVVKIPTGTTLGAAAPTPLTPTPLLV